MVVANERDENSAFAPARSDKCALRDTTPCWSRLGSYVIALRPWSFSASLIPVALGSCLAFKVTGEFSLWIFIITSITALSVHAAGNLVNTYFDFVKGIDSKKSDDRTLVDHILSTNDVVTLGGVLYTVGSFGFLLLTWFSTGSVETLALVYFGGLSSSFLYTGGPGLKYVGLGDVLIFITFGPLTLLFAFLSQGASLNFIPIFYAVPLALHTQAILHANNTRDIESDKEAGIITLPILCGRTASYIMFNFLLFIPYIIYIVMAMKCSLWFFMPMATVVWAFSLENDFRVGIVEFLPQRLAKLNFLIGVLFIFAVYMCKIENLPLLNTTS